MICRRSFREGPPNAASGNKEAELEDRKPSDPTFNPDVAILVVDLFGGAVIGGLGAYFAEDHLRYASYLMSKWAEMKAAYLAEWNRNSPLIRSLRNNAAYRYFLEAQHHLLRGRTIVAVLGSRLPVVGALLTATGIGADIASGESPAQAIASNVAGAVSAGIAGWGAVAFAGAAFGSVVPGVGTAVGFVVGAGVGLGVSAFVDSLFEPKRVAIRFRS